MSDPDVRASEEDREAEEPRAEKERGRRGARPQERVERAVVEPPERR